MEEERGQKALKAEDYLDKIDKIDKLIINKNIEVQQWKDIANNTSAGMDGNEKVQSSSNQQKMADAVVMYMSIEEEIIELMKARNEIAETIQELPASEYDILHKIYFQNMNYNEIALESKKSSSWVSTNRKKAMVHLQAILDKKPHSFFKTVKRIT